MILTNFGYASTDSATSPSTVNLTGIQTLSVPLAPERQVDPYTFIDGNFRETSAPLKYCFELEMFPAQFSVLTAAGRANTIQMKIFEQNQPKFIQTNGSDWGRTFKGLAQVTTTVTVGATSATQQLGNTAGMNAGDILYLPTEDIGVPIKTVIDGTHVQFQWAVTTTTAETVYDTWVKVVLKTRNALQLASKVRYERYKLGFYAAAPVLLS